MKLAALIVVPLVAWAVVFLAVRERRQDTLANNQIRVRAQDCAVYAKDGAGYSTLMGYYKPNSNGSCEIEKGAHRITLDRPARELVKDK